MGLSERAGETRGINMGLDFYVHGLWILGAVFLLVGGLFAGNLQWLEGTTAASMSLSVILTFVLFLLGGLFWVSAAVNAREEQR